MPRWAARTRARGRRGATWASRSRSRGRGNRAPAASPAGARCARRRWQRGVRRVGRDDDAARQVARDLSRLARGRARPEIFEAHRARATGAASALTMRANQPRRQRYFERRRDAMHGAGLGQRRVRGAEPGGLELVRDDVHVISLRRELAREEAESLRADRRARREVIRNDDQRGPGVHAPLFNETGRRDSARTM